MQIKETKNVQETFTPANLLRWKLEIEAMLVPAMPDLEKQRGCTIIPVPYTYGEGTIEGYLLVHISDKEMTGYLFLSLSDRVNIIELLEFVQLWDGFKKHMESQLTPAADKGTTIIIDLEANKDN